MMKYKLIAADMDGTLLNDDSELSQRTKAAILQTVESGAIFVTATGRPLQGAKMVNSLISRDMPVIVLNGAAVFMWESRECLFRKYLDIELAKEVYDIAASSSIPVISWTVEGLWASCECDMTVRYRDFYGIEMRIINSIDELADEGLYKLLWLDSPENITRLQAEMREYFHGRLNCHASRPFMLEFVSLTADKGSAMAELGSIYGIGRSEMIAIGDGFNDISMLEYAGLGVAMENAPDEVKAVCGHVTLSNNDDGAALVMEKYFL